MYPYAPNVIYVYAREEVSRLHIERWKKMTEKNLESKLRAEIKNLGGVAYKFLSPGNSGVPDRIILLPGGKIIFAELKTDEGKLSKLQELQITRIKNLGFDARVVRGLAGVEELLDEIRTA